jgi:hypothetical protein
MIEDNGYLVDICVELHYSEVTKIVIYKQDRVNERP